MRIISKILTSISVFSLLVASFAALACPQQILIIRHGEKPDHGHDLSPEGQKRADLLANFFAAPPYANGGMQKPTYVYAASPGRYDASLREIDTARPTVDQLNIVMNTDVHAGPQSYGTKVVKDVLNLPYADTALIVWEHGRIPLLVSLLTNGKVNLGSWRDSVFDRVLVLNYDKSCQFVDYQDYYQKLLTVLPGDDPNKGCCTKG